MNVLFANIAARYIKQPQEPRSGGLRLAFDVEADGLLDTATKIHCICIVDLDSNDAAEYGPAEILAALEHLARAEVLIGHNALCYDLPLLKKLCDWSPPAECVVRDTLILSRLILPHLGELDDQAKRITQARMKREGVPITRKTDGGLGALRDSHSIEAWGARLGIPKIGVDITDWSQWTPELQARCASDIKICKAIWHLLKPEGYSRYAIELEHRVAPVCEAIEAAGAPCDRDAVIRLAEHVEAKRAPLKAALKRQFPDLNLNSNKQIIALLEARGWKTDQRTKTGKAKLDAEALESIAAVYPEFAGLAEHKKLSKLLALLISGKEALAKHVATDERIHGRVTHMRTPHSRAAHSKPNLAQVPNPKKGTLWGAECRSLFRAPPGWLFVSADENGLQDRGPRPLSRRPRRRRLCGNVRRGRHRYPLEHGARAGAD